MNPGASQSVRDERHTTAVASTGISLRLQLPRNPVCLLVLGHGAGSHMAHATMDAIAQAMLARHLGVFRYNFPFAERGSRRIDARPVILNTVRAALREAHRLVPELPVFAGGHSFGGRMASHALLERKPAWIRGLVFCSFPLHPAGQPSTGRADHLSGLDLPMLFLSGTRDALAEAGLLDAVCGRLPGATLHWLDTADHGYRILKRQRSSDEDVFSEMARVTAEWTRQFT